MVREKKTEQIGRMKEMGFSNKKIAWLIYMDRSEKGQKRVRAILSYIIKKKALPNDSFRIRFNVTQQTEHNNSLRDIVSKLRRRKNFSVVRLWSKGYSVRMIALLLYGDESEQSQNCVYAHISKIRRRSGCDFHAQNLRSRDHGLDFPEQNLRSRVGVVNSTNKTCDFEAQPQPQPQPQPELERMISSYRNGGGEAIPTV